MGRLSGVHDEGDPVNGILVRIGIDQAYGRWNAPVDEGTREFVFVPIPDGDSKQYSPRLRESYEDFRAELRNFAGRKNLPADCEFGFPVALRQHSAHLDPDFHWLTYGDNGVVRGKGISNLKSGDLLVFYSGLQSIQHRKPLVYALTGLYVIDEIVRAEEVPPERYRENAHTRWDVISPNDIVVHARAQVSGRLERCIPIGEFRDRAYRVSRELEAAWGGLSVKNGYLQRSVVPPSFHDAARFYDWFLQQNALLIKRNN